MKRQHGPGQGTRLKIEGGWRDAVYRAANAPKPKAKPKARGRAKTARSPKR